MIYLDDYTFISTGSITATPLGSAGWKLIVISLESNIAAGDELLIKLDGGQEPLFKITDNRVKKVVVYCDANTEVSLYFESNNSSEVNITIKDADISII